ncbi:NAD(P)H-binding protein [Virgibacillus sp. NKC19-16]|uniref:NAD(P)-dependent oxidoreductase n=1 Tax=Virgibacillus salidurans TaxID=2831673 RepID=UPI001F4829BA|nr:NAD(P)H-binding protein [Virgibacillus sp. NKC19-16]UJL46166.1 NAD(P)H-binding protein [Virgibacillus sp. NKC19-16]
MKILILGATGRVGKAILLQALSDQHDVKAFVRSPEKVDVTSKYLTVFQGNVLYKKDLSEAMIDVDVVISALNTDKSDTLSRSMPFIIQEMEKMRVRKIITVGTAGILNSRADSGVYRFQSKESKRRSTTAAEDHLAAYRLLKRSSLDWTIVCPPALFGGKAEGTYRVMKDFLPENGKRITTGDTADFTYSLVDKADFIQTRVGIAN